MGSVLLIAWRYIAFNRLKSVVLVACITITCFLPLTIGLLISHYNDQLMERALGTPLIAAAKGNRFDAVLKTLYFREGNIDTLPAKQADEIRDSGLAEAIPVYARFSAKGVPVVGTTLDYFDFRNLDVYQGRLPGILGEAVIGSKVAEALGVRAGDAILSDQRNLYDISEAYPLKIPVVGVLSESNTADDFAVFTDIKTTWIIEGLGHGHTDVTSASADLTYILTWTDENIVANDALVKFAEITPENIDSFHFHGDPGTYPLSAVIVVPTDRKSGTILKARYNASESYQMLSPKEVIEELMGIVFKVKRFFDANFAIVSLSTLLFLGLVVLLSLRLRKRERETMHKIGCSRAIVFWLQTAELAIIFLISLALTCLLAGVLIGITPNLLRVI